MDAYDRALMARLTLGIPSTDRPFAVLGDDLGMSEDEIAFRVERLLQQGGISRFGPLYESVRVDEVRTLAAMWVPESELEELAEQLAQYQAVARCCSGDREYNLWFVLTAEKPGHITQAIREIERITGYPVTDLTEHDQYIVPLALPI